MQHHLSMQHELSDVECMMLCRPTKKPVSTTNNERNMESSQTSDKSQLSLTDKVSTMKCGTE